MKRSLAIVKRSNVSNVLKDLTNAEISVMLALGFSNRHIMQELGVSINQIAKVVRETGVQRKLYRDGISPVARFVSKKARDKATGYVKRKLLEE